MAELWHPVNMTDTPAQPERPQTSELGRGVNVVVGGLFFAVVAGILAYLGMTYIG